ncbi:hypothetical protein [Streptosporangium sp. NPDC001681]|uniref:hypothetical protein n=1 Tax=Streptosporangium sp. NPDC001681 TaxID=3154395 RepID=UPI00331FF43D
MVLAVLVAAVACLVYRVSVVRALGAGWRIVSALPGAVATQVHGNSNNWNLHVLWRLWMTCG